MINGRVIKIDKNQLNEEFVGVLEKETYYPKPEIVLIVKSFLDKGFSKNYQDDIDTNGYPIKKCVVSMLSRNRQPLRTMSMRELLLMLDDKFNSTIKDDKHRKNFLKQVIRDWFDNKISRDGLLSVNMI